jgi:hypothetical protein
MLFLIMSSYSIFHTTTVSSITVWPMERLCKGNRNSRGRRGGERDRKGGSEEGAVEIGEREEGREAKEEKRRGWR